MGTGRRSGIPYCALFAIGRAVQLRRADDPRLLERLTSLAHERRRFGYRRLTLMLRREGFLVNHNGSTIVGVPQPWTGVLLHS